LEIRVHTEEIEKIKNLKAGDIVLLSGEIYTARDAAHKRLIETINKGEELPFSIKDKIIYYAGPTPSKPGQIIGSCGPTTSGRMDKYAPTLLDMGLLGMIGKGNRDQNVCDAIVRNSAIYFAAIGGAGALISKSVLKMEIICYEDLGTEAIRKLTIKDLYVTVVIDGSGKNLYR
jgi:fumarate hydratase subunit beta